MPPQKWTLLAKTEDIEIVKLSFAALDEKIFNGEIWCAQTIAGWELAKKHFVGKYPEWHK